MIKLVMRNIPYKFLAADDDRGRLTFNILITVMNESVPGGKLAPDALMIWGRIGAKFDQLPSEVTLDPTQIEFLKRHFEKASLPAAEAINAVVLMDHLEELVQKFKERADEPE